MFQEIKNEFAVAGGTLEEAPKALWAEISNDCQNHKKKLALLEGSAVVIAATAGALLSRSPMLSSFIIGMGEKFFGIMLATDAIMTFSSVSKRAWHANTQTERQELSREAGQKLGKWATPLLETAPAFVIGGFGGAMVSRSVPALDNVAFKVTEKVEFPFRSLASHWTSPSIAESLALKKLPASLKNADGTINLFEISTKLAKLRPGSDVEELSFVRLSDSKLSPNFKGLPLKNHAMLPDESHIMYHTHLDGMRIHKGIAGDGNAFPTVVDVLSAKGTQILQSGDLTTFYTRILGESQQIKKFNVPFEPEWQGITLDKKKMQADLIFGADNRNKVDITKIPLDYKKTTELLSHWHKDDNVNWLERGFSLKNNPLFGN